MTDEGPQEPPRGRRARGSVDPGPEYPGDLPRRPYPPPQYPETVPGQRRPGGAPGDTGTAAQDYPAPPGTPGQAPQETPGRRPLRLARRARRDSPWSGTGHRPRRRAGAVTRRPPRADRMSPGGGPADGTPPAAASRPRAAGSRTCPGPGGEGGKSQAAGGTMRAARPGAGWMTARRIMPSRAPASGRGRRAAAPREEPGGPRDFYADRGPRSGPRPGPTRGPSVAGGTALTLPGAKPGGRRPAGLRKAGGGDDRPCGTERVPRPHRFPGPGTGRRRRAGRSLRGPWPGAWTVRQARPRGRSRT